MPVMTGLGGSEDRRAGGDTEEEERHHGDGGGGVHRAGGEDGSEGEDWSVMAGDTALGSERVGVGGGQDCSEESGLRLSLAELGGSATWSSVAVVAGLGSPAAWSPVAVVVELGSSAAWSSVAVVAELGSSAAWSSVAVVAGQRQHGPGLVAGSGLGG